MPIPDSHLAGMTDAELIREAINADPLTRILAERLEEMAEWAEPISVVLEVENYELEAEPLKAALIELRELREREETRAEVQREIIAAALRLS